jgi:hypothetical protein
VTPSVADGPRVSSSVRLRQALDLVPRIALAGELLPERPPDPVLAPSPPRMNQVPGHEGVDVAGPVVQCDLASNGAVDLLEGDRGPVPDTALTMLRSRVLVAPEDVAGDQATDLFEFAD